MVCDEAAIHLWLGAGYGWRPANGHDTIRRGFSKKPVRLFGSLGTDGYRIRTADAINSETFIGFLQDLLKACPKFVMVLDNASCHRFKMVTGFVESAGGDIRPVFLPPYTPQLNPSRCNGACSGGCSLAGTFGPSRNSKKPQWPLSTAAR